MSEVVFEEGAAEGDGLAGREGRQSLIRTPWTPERVSQRTISAGGADARVVEHLEGEFGRRSVVGHLRPSARAVLARFPARLPAPTIENGSVGDLILLFQQRILINQFIVFWNLRPINDGFLLDLNFQWLGGSDFPLGFSGLDLNQIVVVICQVIGCLDVDKVGKSQLERDRGRFGFFRGREEEEENSAKFQSSKKRRKCLLGNLSDDY